MAQKRNENLLAELVQQVQYVDELATVVLKGHLVLEQVLVRIIGKFVHHSQHVPDRLQFAQRVGLARSMSLDEADNSMWDLLLAVNTLRNKLAHSLESAERQKAYDRLKEVYVAEVGDARIAGDEEPHHLALYALAHCLGFLGSFESEVERFKEHVDAMDRIVNPHRHGSASAC